MSSPDEREVKARITDPAQVRQSLRAAGAVLGFRGFMRDRRYDREGELEKRDEVLRVRRYVAETGSRQPGDEGGRGDQITWKGPTRRSPEGHKLRRELELDVAGGVSPAELLEALGYRVVQSIDRYVEIYQLAAAVLRLEWYPRMDVLLEIEGSTEAIEAGVTASGVSRAQFVPESLAEFVARFEERTQQRAILAESDLRGATPDWRLR